MIITLCGANEYLRRRELERIMTDFATDHSDMAIERFDGEEASVERMRESLQSPPFLSVRKLVVLREPGKQTAFAENITTILKDMAETTDLILYEPKLDKRSSYYKILKKATDFCELTELDVAGLSQWASTYAKEKGGQVSAADARFLVDRIGHNQQLLQNELDKLLAYDGKITRLTIELLTEATPQSTVFELLDAAFAGKSQQAFQLYREQRALKVEPQAIIALLAWQLHVLAVVKTAGARSPELVAKEAKLNPFVVRKSLGLARRLTLAHLKEHIAELLELDLQLKSMAIDADDALQLYLLKIAKQTPA